MPGGVLAPRAPVVHFFICDNGNAKVKTFSDQFVGQLTRNGIKVYSERFQMHQPGFQVRAVSMNTPADFFFQIHSKTAGPGHVRLYVNGQPKRMTRDEAMAEIWSTWRVRCGSLAKEEVDLLSAERILWLLSEYGGISETDLKFNELQTEIRQRFTEGLDVSDLLNDLRELERVLIEGKGKISNCRPMTSEWVFEPGAQLQRIVPMAATHGLSPPLKDRLIRVIDQYIRKTAALLRIVERRLTLPLARPPPEETDVEIPIESSPAYDGHVWRMLVESCPDDHMGSFRIASYGDNHASAVQDVVVQNPAFLLEEFES
jgi:hypothetical protein